MYSIELSIANSQDVETPLNSDMMQKIFNDNSLIFVEKALEGGLVVYYKNKYFPWTNLETSKK